MNTDEDQHLLYFPTKPTFGVRMYGWCLERPDGGTNRSAMFPDKTEMLANCVNILQTELRNPKITFDTDAKTKHDLFVILDGLYPEKTLKEALEEQGLTVVKSDDWQDRGHGDWMTIKSGLH